MANLKTNHDRTGLGQLHPSMHPTHDAASFRRSWPPRRGLVAAAPELRDAVYAARAAGDEPSSEPHWTPPVRPPNNATVTAETDTRRGRAGVHARSQDLLVLLVPRPSRRQDTSHHTTTLQGTRTAPVEPEPPATTHHSISENR
jgi:hypothetical protein